MIARGRLVHKNGNQLFLWLLGKNWQPHSHCHQHVSIHKEREREGEGTGILHASFSTPSDYGQTERGFCSKLSLVA